MVAVELAAVGLMEENATKEAGKLEVQPKDLIDQSLGNCKPVIRNEPVRYPSPLQQFQTTMNIAIEEQNHHGYKLDTEQTTVLDQHTLQGGQPPQRSLEPAP